MCRSKNRTDGLIRKAFSSHETSFRFNDEFHHKMDNFFRLQFDTVASNFSSLSDSNVCGMEGMYIDMRC